MKRRYAAAGAALALILLSLWGMFRGGTAARLVPETAKPERAMQAEAAEETPQSGLLYEADKYIRTRPLRDPFRVEAKPADKTEAAGSEGGGKPDAALPALRGILIAGGDRRAVLDAGGETKTVKEGERVGAWTVTEIAERRVVLTGPAGEAVLVL